MVKEEDISKSRIVQVFLIVGIIISFIMVVQLVRNRTNFDNALLKGDYNGSLLIDNRPIYILNVTFNGQGFVNGSINYEGNIDYFSSEYLVANGEFHMAFSINSSLGFQLVGDLIDDGQEISGDIQMYESDSIYNGTYSLLKITS